MELTEFKEIFEFAFGMVMFAIVNMVIAFYICKRLASPKIIIQEPAAESVEDIVSKFLNKPSDFNVFHYDLFELELALKNMMRFRPTSANDKPKWWDHAEQLLVKVNTSIAFNYYEPVIRRTAMTRKVTLS